MPSLTIPDLPAILVGARWRRLTAALLACAAVLAVHRDAYWRPFNDAGQESLPSFHAYGFAAANGASWGLNPIVARHIDVGHSRIQPYPHWPNGFFLLFEAVLRVFGRTETVGRSFAVLWALLGFMLVVVSLQSDGWLLYGTLPLLLLSAAGRDSVPFVFIDAALYFWIGLLFWILAHRSGSRRYNLVFRTAVVAGLLFNSLLLPYAAAIALLKCFEKRSGRALAVDLAVLGASALVVFLCLAAAVGDLATGTRQLLHYLEHRSQEPWESWTAALSQDLVDSLNLGPLSIPAVAVAWLIVALGRQWRPAVLLPSYLLFAVVLRQYVTQHHFARLPLVFFSLVTLAAAAEVMIGRLERRRNWRAVANVARPVLFLLLVLPITAGTRRYETEPTIEASRRALMQIVSDPRWKPALDRCNAFVFPPTPGHADPMDRMAQFFFGARVVERVRRGEAVRSCVVNLAERSVQGPL